MTKPPKSHLNWGSPLHKLGPTDPRNPPGPKPKPLRFLYKGQIFTQPGLAKELGISDSAVRLRRKRGQLEKIGVKEI